jgi:AcrR family transcriptional regulator
MKKRAAMKAGRKPPQQSRSRVTVSAILDAMIRVLEHEGPEAASTSRVAEIAGVSVGTLYQYFANRDAILDALQDREFERAGAMIQRVLAPPGGVPDRAVARRVVEELLRLYRAAPALHRVLAVEGLRVTAPERVLAFDQRMVALIRSFLALAGMSIRRTNLDAAAFVIYQAVRAAMLAYLLESPPGVDDAALVEEVTALVLGYLVEDTSVSRSRVTRPVGGNSRKKALLGA